MAKNKRERNQNSQPFLADGDSVASSKKRSKAPKHHQKQDKMLSTGISSKILKEALLQQKEIEDEASGGNVRNAFGSVEEEHNKHEEEKEEDIDNFGGFFEAQSQFGNYEVSLFYVIIYFFRLLFDVKLLEMILLWERWVIL
ncbi:bystin [Gossypium raimondii]|nr:bystin [Gossypium raimondii]XP_052477363.1 bystin [Gossypium raimondii]